MKHQHDFNQPLSTESLQMAQKLCLKCTCGAIKIINLVDNTERIYSNEDLDAPSF